jgi:hypothetical protein
MGGAWDLLESWCWWLRELAETKAREAPLTAMEIRA